MIDDDPLAGGDVQEAAGVLPAVDADGQAAGPSLLGAFDIDAIATKEVADVITGIIAGMTKEALERALTPERVELMQACAEAAVQHSFEDESGPTLIYGSADEWLRKYWRYTYRRRVSAKGNGTGRWRADWWSVDEAVQRIEALWRSWETSRLDAGLGMSTWWINHAEPHMGALLATDGPFTNATDENLPGEPLPYAEPPDGMFEPDIQA
ncbi:DUF4913 domain-containing protein (plasmid) [Rathayibacter sp. VKM Ac-2803]|uniref:DUF4913 domain-containing protein n=1 Tax=Rathayibacter caricis DSM 15933 TaxID=1328867 RepID=A0A2T4UP95_9MICO|nr:MULTISPECIES: DUF4913 domain-containing protein [Rathayibacter]MWV51536.1 DUF4913 domain-containing protein [Rathayibacter sp. VKM Ac-2803]PTL71356.1 DUF4913 domain-containing protein [Rathayibacter caricis DSM 15933]